MESFHLTLIFLISLILVFLFIIFYRHSSNYRAANLPPGRIGLPFIGESLEFLSAGWKGYPEKFILERVARYSSTTFKTHIFGQPMAILSGTAGNKFLFTNENKLVTTWWPDSVYKVFPSSSETSLYKESTKMRKLLPHFMKPEALQRHIGVMDTVAQTHFASCWANKDQVVVFSLAKRYTFWLACRLLLSIDQNEHLERLAAEFHLLASGIISIPIDLPGTPFNKAIKASKLIRKELLVVIKQRKNDLAMAKGNAAVTQDILSHMLSYCDDENGQFMTERDIADKILGLLIGGHDTASATCTFIVKFLAELPHIYQAVYTEQMEIAKSKAEGELLNWKDIQKMKYSWNVACEVMRLAPPLQGGFREAIHDFTFNGRHIPKGWKLYWSASSTHKDPGCFVEPERFDPSRFEGNGPAPYTYVPFGGGPRMCPGKEYARLEILVFMHNLVKGFKWEKLVPDERIIVNPMPIPEKGLPIRLYT